MALPASSYHNLYPFFDQFDLINAPKLFNTILSNTKNTNNLKYKLQVYIDDYVGCGLCIKTCPSKNKALEFSTLKKEKESGEIENYIYFDKLKENITEGAIPKTLKYKIILPKGVDLQDERFKDL